MAGALNSIAPRTPVAANAEILLTFIVIVLPVRDLRGWVAFLSCLLLRRHWIANGFHRYAMVRVIKLGV